MSFPIRQITAADLPAVFDARVSTRENHVSMEDLHLGWVATGEREDDEERFEKTRERGSGG
jgi:hypothetical protein